MACSTCKKSKVIKKLEPVIEPDWIPTQDDINLAYAELTSHSGVRDDKREFINKVYEFIFQESFNFDNGNIGFNQARRFKNFLGK